MPIHNEFHPVAVMLGDANTKPCAYTDVYIDDFMVIAQQPHCMPTMNNLLTAIHQVFIDIPASNCKQVP
jgi:hypothetical protein